MNSFKKNPNLNFILDKGRRRGGGLGLVTFYKESKPKI